MLGLCERYTAVYRSGGLNDDRTAPDRGVGGTTSLTYPAPVEAIYSLLKLLAHSGAALFCHTYTQALILFQAGTRDSRCPGQPSTESCWLVSRHDHMTRVTPAAPTQLAGCFHSSRATARGTPSYADHQLQDCCLCFPDSATAA